MYREQVSQIDYGYGYGVPSRPGPSGALIAGGVFAILAGVLALGQGLLYSSFSSAFAYVSGSNSLCLCGGLDVLFGAFSLVAGVFALKGKNFALALTGSVFGMLGIGFLIGFVFGLVAIILIAVSKNDFD